MTVGSFFLAMLFSASARDAYIEEVAVAGATLRIEVRQPVDRRKAEQITTWIAATAEAVGKTYGRFPNPNPKIVVLPSSRRSSGARSAVSYGQVTRRNGGRVELYVNAERPIEEFYADWTATHEFSHFMLPLLDRRYRWISEGFATYYQNILMARADHYTREFAWQRLTDGFARGAESRPELSPNQAAAAGTGRARMKIYWSGAALALRADVELRRRSGGAQTLDSVLGRLHQCCLPTERRWSGPALFRQLDSFLDAPLFMPLYRQYANQAGFPDVQEMLIELGVSNAGRSVSFNDRSSLADLRNALTQAPSVNDAR